jgi:hypothetical protein
MKQQTRSTCELCGKYLGATERLMFDRCKECRVPAPPEPPSTRSQ